jgi:ABC-type uncharacterized transport system auxiliary subunit
MPRPRARVPALALLLVAALSGCSLLPEPEPAPRTYGVPVAAGPARVPGQPVGLLRLRAITPAAHLDDGIAWRSGLEMGTRTDARWVERPDVVLKHALMAQLYSDGRLVRSESLQAPLLDVELLAFEELLEEQGAVVAHVALQARLLDAARQEVLALDLQARRPVDVSGDRNASLARALGEGTDEVCAQLAREIVRAMGGDGTR